VAVKSDFQGSPPCLISLASSGFPPGTRNNALFNLGVYLKKAHPDDWTGRLDAYNQRYLTPPLSSQEVSVVAKSLAKKSYSYKCQDLPLKGACNRQICLTCEHGVGGGANEINVVMGDLVKILMDISVWVNPMKPAKWAELVQTAMARVTTVTPPEDATLDGQLWAHLGRFCTGKAVGRSLDEILIGKPYTNPATGRTHFCSIDFLEFLRGRRVQTTERKLWAFLRERGATHHFDNLKGKGVNHWSVPAFDQQTSGFDVPQQMEREF
jgi:hypothetical protein